jgi:hypothetical protein
MKTLIITLLCSASIALVVKERFNHSDPKVAAESAAKGPAGKEAILTKSSGQPDLRKAWKAWLTTTIQPQDGSGAILVGTNVELLSKDGSNARIRYAGREFIAPSWAVTVDTAEAAAAQWNAAVAQQQQQHDAAAQAARAQKTRIQGFVSGKTNDGSIVELSVRGGVSHNATDVPMGINNPIGGPGWTGFNRVFLRGCSDQENLADGDRVDTVAYDSGTASLGGSTYHCYTCFSR